MSKRFAVTLTSLMAERGIKRPQLAKAVGVSVTSVGNWCSGTGTPGHDRMVRIAEFLGVKLSTLIDAAADGANRVRGPQLAMPPQAQFDSEIIQEEGALKLSADEQALIRVWRLLNTDEKRIIMRAAGVDYSILRRLFYTTA